MQQFEKQKGFSLVELSIVLVILGLLTGGILTGQNLIRAAELRSVVTEYQSYLTALRTFQDKYFAVPGDMANATAFWGSAGGSGTIGDGCEAAAGTGTETCNGDGSGGRLENIGAANEYMEKFTFWQHLTNAGMIEGTYTGKAGALGQHDVEVGTNTPQSRLSNAGWGVAPLGSNTGLSGLFDGNYGNSFEFGKESPVDGVSLDILRPEEAWGIDKKVDDGMPATGKLVVRRRRDCTNATTAVADSDNFDSIYSLIDSNIVCSLVFRDLF